MNSKKTVADRLREVGEGRCAAYLIEVALTGEGVEGCPYRPCSLCVKQVVTTLADMIEAEQAELRERVDELNSTFIDLAALDLLCEKLDMSPDLRGIAEQIRAATKPMKRPQRPHEVDVDVDVIPDGIQWPRFEDGELVKFGDKFIGSSDGTSTVTTFHFHPDAVYVNCSNYYGYGVPVKRPEPDVLDADGVPIKVGDTMWYEGEEFVVVDVFRDGVNLDSPKKDECGFAVHSVGNAEPDFCTHRKPDSHGDVEDDATLPPREYCNHYELMGADSAYCDDAECVEAMCKHLIQRTREICERQRKLMGGE